MNVTLTQEKLLTILKPNSEILDIGGGKGRQHAKFFESFGHKVMVNDFFDSSQFVGKFTEIDFNQKFDCVWSSHCLEHQLNVNNFLKKVNSVCKDDGIICITVPPLKHTIVGGHVTLWNAGLLLYNLVMANLDCSQAMIKSYGYNISVIVKKKYIELPKLVYDRGDLKTLINFFPKEIKSDHLGQFQGVINNLNWD
jgi:SAM-dependent methyltransferase